MADQVTVRLTGNWRGLRFLLNVARVDEALQKAVRHATGVNAQIIRREIRENIKTGKYAPSRPPNAALTMFIKGSSKPLVDTGHLFQAITSEVIDFGRAEIGVSRMARDAQVAIIVHEGAVVRVTQRMRRMFRALADVSNGKRDASSLRGRAAALYARRRKGWKPLKPSTTHIVIPPRPFIAEVLESPKVQRRVYENWLEAAGAAIAGTRPKLRTGI
jgi:hypothetical protein